MRRSRWTPAAAEDFAEAIRYMRADNETAALDAARSIYSRIEQLALFPSLGRPGREAGTRELVPTPLPYLVVYRLEKGAIQVLHIRHGARAPKRG